MIKSFFVAAIVLLSCALIEAAILSNIAIIPAIPDLSLICLLYISFHNGKLLGEGSGFISGLFLDFLSAAPFGLNCLYRTIIGFVAGIFNKTINTEGLLVPALLGALATIFKSILILFISFFFPLAVIAYNPISWMFVFELGINTILTPIIFKLLNLFKNSLVLTPETMV